MVESAEKLRMGQLKLHQGDKLKPDLEQRAGLRRTRLQAFRTEGMV